MVMVSYYVIHYSLLSGCASITQNRSLCSILSSLSPPLFTRHYHNQLSVRKRTASRKREESRSKSMQQSRVAICTALRSTTWKTTCRGFARIRSREAPINPKSEASLAAAAAKELRWEQAAKDAEEHSSDSSRTPFEETPFFAKASKIISDMSSKKTNLDGTMIKEGEVEEGNSWNWVPPRDGGKVTAEHKTTNFSSTSIKEGEIEQGNSWNWVPPRDGGEDTADIIPVIKGFVSLTLQFLISLSFLAGTV